MEQQFLPTNRAEMEARGWGEVDFVYVNGDAYVDHPSFGAAIITRVLEDAGFRIGFLAQPDFRSAEAFRTFGRPRLGFLVSAGNIDSMVAHYTAAKKKRSYDYYSPGGKPGLRPDRATIVYSNRIREAYGDIPIILGGIEASLRRFAHYDYWDDKVRRSLLVDSRADMITYGMGEKILVAVAKLLDRGVPIRKIRDVRGTVFLIKKGERVHFPAVETYDYDTLKTDKRAYADAYGIQYRNQDAIYGKAILEDYGDKVLVQNPPMPPLEREELDHVYALPYMRTWHPMYAKDGGVPAIEEVQLFDHAQPRLLRRLQLLRARVPPGAHRALPQHRVGRPRGEAHHRDAGFQGLHSRRRRSDRQFPLRRVQKAAYRRRLRGAEMLGAHALQEPRRRPQRVHRAAPRGRSPAEGEEGVHPLGHPL